MSTYDPEREKEWTRMHPGDPGFREYAIGYSDAALTTAQRTLSLVLDGFTRHEIEQWLRDVICRWEEHR